MKTANRLRLRKGHRPAVLLSIWALLSVDSALAGSAPLLDCLIKPYRVVDLASPVPGVIAQLHVDRSDYLEEGAIAASLESSVEQATVVLAQARADIDSEVQANSVNLAYDQRRLERIETLYEKKTVSIDLKDEADRGQSLSRWRLQQARDLKEVRALELARAKEQLEQKTVRTPISGYVLKRFKQVGEYVEDQPIMRVAQLDPLSVEAVVPLELRASIERGQRALVYPTTPGAEPVEAEVTVIDPVADAATGTFGVKLKLPNPDNAILSGVKCTLNIGAVSLGQDLARR